MMYHNLGGMVMTWGRIHEILPKMCLKIQQQKNYDLLKICANCYSRMMSYAYHKTGAI